MRINRLTLLAGAALTLGAGLLSGAVYADTGAGSAPRGLLGQADTNHDGVIDQSEFQASRDKWFAELDTDHDGFITADELKAFGDKMHARRASADQTQQQSGSTATAPAANDRGERIAQHILAQVDTDHDGKISKAEFDAQSQAMFKRLDKNGDGKIEAAELPQRHWTQMGSRMFDKMDTNGDGKVTKAEFTAANDQLFQKLDVNGDGVITKDEMTAAQHHGKRKPADGQLPDQNAAPAQTPTP
jgi:Ca2+-binding EF-hand superfamily protein